MSTQPPPPPQQPPPPGTPPPYEPPPPPGAGPAAPPPASYLRPLRVGEILDRAFSLTRRNFKNLVAISAAIVIPLAIIDAILLAATLHNGFVSDGKIYLYGGAGGYNAGRYLFTLLQVIGSLVITAACFRLLSAAYLGGQSDRGESLRAAFGRLLPIIGAAVIITVMTVIGFILLILPGIWIFVACSVAIPVLMLEGVGAFGAVDRSMKLVRGKWWHTFILLLVTVIFIVVVETVVLGVVIGPILLSSSHSLAAAGVEQVVTLIIGELIVRPFEAAVLIVLYYDLRVRKEGLDVELMARDAGLMAHPQPAAAAPSIATDAPGGLPSG